MGMNDRDLLAKTLMAEAGNQGISGMMDVGSVLMNRVNASGYGNGIRGVIMKPGQVSAWNSKTGHAGGEQGQDVNAMRPSAEIYQAADALLSGNYQDQTGGATHYYNDKYSQPSWGKRAGGDWQRRGDHLFGFGNEKNRSSVAADAMQVLGKTLPQTANSGILATPQERPEPMQQPRGLLGSLGLQKMQDGAEGETGQRFFQRDSFKDASAKFGQAFAALGSNPGVQKMANEVAGQRTELKARNKTTEYLRANGLGDMADMVEAGEMSAGAVMSQIVKQRLGGGPDDPTDVRSLRMKAEMAGLVPGTKEYQDFVINGGGAPSNFRALDMQAVASGYKRGTPEYQEFMATRGSGLQEGAVLAARTDGAGSAEAAKVGGKMTAERAFEAYDQAAGVSKSMGSISEAIAAIDSGAESGFFQKYIPNITEASASLEVAMNKMGLDVISSVTFGALSEKEMSVAMATAVPQDLRPGPLRAWLVDKLNAQTKAREALMSAARYLSQPGNTIGGWMDEQEKSGGGIKTQTLPPSGVTDEARVDALKLLNLGGKD